MKSGVDPLSWDVFWHMPRLVVQSKLRHCTCDDCVLTRAARPDPWINEYMPVDGPAF